MVIYDFTCAAGHHFEGWFESRQEFVSQQEGGLLECPVCGSTDVEKQLHTTGLSKGRERRAAPTLAEAQHRLREAVFEAASYIRANSEDVGSRFTEEAIAIHRGESESRSIRGNATEEEESSLAEEGVPYLRIALPKHDA